jgi:hypothetical protein
MHGQTRPLFHQASLLADGISEDLYRLYLFGGARSDAIIPIPGCQSRRSPELDNEIRNLRQVEGELICPD